MTADYTRASKTVACVVCPPGRALPDEAVEEGVPAPETVELHPEGLTPATPPSWRIPPDRHPDWTWSTGMAGRPQGWSSSGATTPGWSG